MENHSQDGGSPSHSAQILVQMMSQLTEFPTSPTQRKRQRLRRNKSTGPSPTICNCNPKSYCLRRPREPNAPETGTSTTRTQHRLSANYSTTKPPSKEEGDFARPPTIRREPTRFPSLAERNQEQTQSRRPRYW